ncbi:hypothetical protein PHLGIDRAFT_139204 [Phlebiopsis gigantea 11061_1 CR5-6]|uniref:Uncharacterized protein n=1 Tax=Phlebiopsis gigantea (strain 11061_1 CR5-6) TaxID=745531 RepID=A0A0C3P0E4_PHLG1|nr:hypothetical protein PHLGIDRAFT_139204 [Phlebiopsis gigantea 11061_1 CR5-6]
MISFQSMNRPTQNSLPFSYSINGRDRAPTRRTSMQEETCCLRVLTPESLPADFDALETPYDVHGATYANEVPTFSMPEEHSDGLSGEQAPVVDQLYTGLPLDLPEGADILSPVVLDGIEDSDMPELHDRASEAPRVSPQGHLDWNLPPAFSSGRPATAAGHLKTLSDAAASRNHASDTDDGQAIEEPEIVVISDEEDEPDVTGLPLGTSDLDIPADAAYADDDDSGDDSGHDNDNEDEAEGSVEMDEDVEEDAIQGLPEEFGPEMVDMFKDGQLSTEGLIEVQSKEHIGDDQFSFDDFESLYTNSEGFASLEGDESTNMVEEHLEPIVVEDTDFGSLPTPSGAPGLGSLTNHAVADFYEAFSHAEIETSLPTSAEDPSTELLAPEVPSSVPRERDSAQPVENDSSEVIVEIVVSTMTESGVVEEYEPEEDDVREQSMISDGFEVATYHGETPAADECQVVEEATDEERDISRSQSMLSDDVNLLTRKDGSLLVSAEFHVEEGVGEDSLTTP